MKSINEYLRLPRGMHDRDSNWVAHENEILNYHNQCGQSIGCDVVKYSQVSFKSTFTRECNTANDKIYEFDDRAGRKLVLTCDSTASILRNYVSSDIFEARRISFISPMFRYRRSGSNNRFFTQIGYCFINENSSKSSVDFHLIQLTQAMKKLISSCGIKTKIYLNDYDAFRKVILKYIKNDSLKSFIYRFQFADSFERTQLLEEVVTDKIDFLKLTKMFSSGVNLIRDGFNETINNLDLPDEYLNIYAMAKAMQDTLNEDIYFCPTDFHCIETIDGFTIRLMTNDDYAIAEGGEYSKFANRFDSSIHTFWSMASGVEPLERLGNWNVKNSDNLKVGIYSFNASDSFIIRVLKKVKDIGFIPCYLGECISAKLAVRHAKKIYSKCIIVGEQEEERMEIRIKNFSDSTFDVVKILDMN